MLSGAWWVPIGLIDALDEVLEALKKTRDVPCPPLRNQAFLVHDLERLADVQGAAVLAQRMVLWEPVLVVGHTLDGAGLLGLWGSFEARAASSARWLVLSGE
jgi:hypothetical protein